MTDLAGRIHAVLAAACLGNALGAATEGMSRGEIRSIFGGRVDRFMEPPPRAPFAEGLTPGRLTDDATQMLAMADILIKTSGQPTADDAVAGLVAWADQEEMFRRFAGPTTRLAVERLRAGVDPRAVATPERYSCSYGASNGAAMRAPVAGAVRAGDIPGAVRLAAILASPTHNTQIAFSGAGAVAGAIAAGLADRGSLSLAKAAIAGARAGEALGPEMGRVVGGASVARRLDLALTIAAQCADDPDRAIVELEEAIGNGVAMAEAVPTAIALAVVVSDPWRAILAAVNAGNDSDTIAMIAGAVAAAWHGLGATPPRLVAELEAVNRLDLAATARSLAGIASRR